MRKIVIGRQTRGTRVMTWGMIPIDQMMIHGSKLTMLRGSGSRKCGHHYRREIRIRWSRTRGPNRDYLYPPEEDSDNDDGGSQPDGNGKDGHYGFDKEDSYNDRRGYGSVNLGPEHPATPELMTDAEKLLAHSGSRLAILSPALWVRQ